MQHSDPHSKTVNESQKLKQLDKKYVWHPFTQMRDYLVEDPLVIAKAKGPYLIDTEGKRYLDGVSSLWVNVHGHGVTEIDEALKDQINNLSHSTLLGLTHPTAALLAQKLIEITPPNLTRVFYSDNGSTATEIALKMAFQYWQHRGLSNKKEFIAFENAYHGDTIGAVSVGGINLFHQIFHPLLFDVHHVNFENAFNEIRAKKDCLAGVIIEPMMQGAAGMLRQPKGFLKELKKVCDQNDVLLIFDEVATGFGRTGKMFALEHEQVHPDFLCVAKGITGGYLPLAATIASEKIYEAFLAQYEELKTFFHGHTYTANPLACRAALANLELFEKNQVLLKMQPQILYLENKLKRLYDIPAVYEIRQLGFMIGIELMKNPQNKIPYDLKEKIGIKVTQKARQKGLVIRPLGPVIVLMPPLVLNQEQIDFLVDTTYESILETYQELN